MAFKVFLNPSDHAKDNLITHKDLMNTEHYERNLDKIKERFKYTAAKKVFADMVIMQADVYVFSEKEMNEFIKKIRSK